MMFGRFGPTVAMKATPASSRARLVTMLVTAWAMSGFLFRDPAAAFADRANFVEAHGFGLAGAFALAAGDFVQVFHGQASCVRTLTGIYAGVLDEIERREWDVFGARPRLSALGKLRVIGVGIAREAA